MLPCCGLEREHFTLHDWFHMQVSRETYVKVTAPNEKGRPVLELGDSPKVGGQWRCVAPVGVTVNYRSSPTMTSQYTSVEGPDRNTLVTPVKTHCGDDFNWLALDVPEHGTLYLPIETPHGTAFVPEDLRMAQVQMDQASIVDPLQMAMQRGAQTRMDAGMPRLNPVDPLHQGLHARPGDMTTVRVDWETPKAVPRRRGELFGVRRMLGLRR